MPRSACWRPAGRPTICSTSPRSRARRVRSQPTMLAPAHHLSGPPPASPWAPPDARPMPARCPPEDPLEALVGRLRRSAPRGTKGRVGAADRPTAKRRARNISAPGVEELGSRLSDRFETKVKIQIGRAKGRIVVEFGSVDDLQRIIGVMAPEITGRRPDA